MKLLLILTLSIFSRAQGTQDLNAATPHVEGLVKSERFQFPAGARDASVVYGSKGMGYFERKNLRRNGAFLWLDFVVPTYREPIEFKLKFISKSGKPVILPAGQKRYPPLKTEIAGAHAKVEGRFTSSFVLTIGTLTAGHKTTFGPVIINKFGELVWYLPSARGWTALAPTTQPLGHGEFIEFLSEHATRAFDNLIRFDESGKILQSFDFPDKRIPVPTHGFQYLPATREILYTSVICRELPWYREFVPLFSGVRGWWKLWTLPRRGYWGGEIVRLNLNTLTFRGVWNDYVAFSPDKNPSLFSGATNRADFFMDAQNDPQYLALIHQEAVKMPNGKTCHVDWTHANSVDYRPGIGYLISLRNLNKIILVDEKGDLKWTMGEGPDNTFAFPYGGSSFSMQHSATFLSDERILIFDNNSAYRGNTGGRGVSRLMTVQIPKAPGPLKAEWTLSLDRQAPIKGSATALPNGNYFAYVPGDKNSPQEIFEIDPAKDAVVGRMMVDMPNESSGFQVLPMNSIADELVQAPAAAPRAEPLKMHPENWQNLIDRTY